MKLSVEIDEVYTFKLGSGEELIAKVKSIDDGFIIIDEPVSIAPTPQGMGLVPSMFTVDTKKEIRLNTNSVSLSGPTEDAIKDRYLEATTGIKVPSKKIILG